MVEYIVEYDDCLKCSLKYCQADCFNDHVGSDIALGKAIREVQDKKGTKVHIAGRLNEDSLGQETEKDSNTM